MRQTPEGTANESSEFGSRPRDDELDLFGITHVGYARTENQDHFLVATVHPELIIRETSLPAPQSLPIHGTRLATVMLVADGVGGSTGGREASRLAIEAIMRYVSSTLRCYHAAGSTEEKEFVDALREATLEAHASVRAEAATRPDSNRMATTLTLFIAVWPWAYVVQVGDSRCYQFDGAKLRQMTRDQTIAQDLVDQGVLPRDRVAKSPFSHVLASAIGADAALPEVSRVRMDVRKDIFLLCSDGLTKHVKDDEIAAELMVLKSSEGSCRRLLELALERGGSDNVTVLIARARTQATPGDAHGR
jgi:serine/threonine protein phosphatase PrpC